METITVEQVADQVVSLFHSIKAGKMLR